MATCQPGLPAHGLLGQLQASLPGCLPVCLCSSACLCVCECLHCLCVFLFWLLHPSLQNDVLEYETSSDTWKAYEVKGQPPKPLAYHTATTAGHLIVSHECSLLHHTAEHSIAKHSTAEHGTYCRAWQSTVLHCTAWHGTAQHSTARHVTARHGTAQHSAASG